MKNKLRVYQYANCDTCRQAVKWLKGQGYEPELLPIFEAPPSEEELSRLIPLSGLPIAKWFNVAGEAYRELGLKDKLPSMTDEEKIRLLASNGRLIKRPVITDGKRVTVGFREDAKAAWSKDI
ncbi:arsenate reductase family protein [Cohnella zeiphila]|uniref:Arsenate reductase family protein n=1 Tax=Cohnella zeiphila TaxID=2761120 RepID=A0A7X0SJP0_9BACL|nr:arsenate reductase family protein [Cohnella zeiphila]MBB6731126.1 arsenate reductase family protein [Cohnella zeiphila]